MPGFGVQAFFWLFFLLILSSDLCIITIRKHKGEREMATDKKWLRLLVEDVTNRKDDNLMMMSDGTTIDIAMSQKIGDEWFFGFANSKLDELIPNFCMESSLYAIANDCLIRMFLSGLMDEEMLQDLLDTSIKTAKEMIERDQE